jgi:hypothetical protein
MTVICVVPSRQAGAYGGACHPYAIGQAYEIFSFPELEDLHDSVANGSTHEDEVDHIYGHSGPGGWLTTLTHFWVADDGDEQLNHWVGYGYANAWMKARKLLRRAILYYQEYIDLYNTDRNNPELFRPRLKAYHYLGHALHLLGDMGVPAHAHYDEHSDDSYEEWMKSDPEHPDGNAACGYWNAYNAMSQHGEEVDLPEDRIEMILSNPEGSFPWVPNYPGRLYASLYYLMYTTNQRSDPFASDGDDGNFEEELVWVDYSVYPEHNSDPVPPYWELDLLDNDDCNCDVDGQLSLIANRVYPYVIWATAAMYKEWRDHFDNVSPMTQINVIGPPVMVDNWRPGDVEVVLASEDYSDGVALHDSGIYDIHWNNCRSANWDSYQAPANSHNAITNFPIIMEGANRLCYSSKDNFGNLADIKEEVIKIDKSAPIVSIVSPAPGGFYLTSETLIIDFEATDVISGIYATYATMDGVEVQDGEVLDLAALGGHHTIEVAASDLAGNIAAESVDFSVKIHAAIDVKPDILNVKSMGKNVVAYIEFPTGYDVSLIDVSTVNLNVNGQDVPAEPHPSTSGDYDKDGELDVMVQFDRQLVVQAVTGIIGNIEMVVYGELDDSTEFYGEDIVEIFKPGNGPI